MIDCQSSIVSHQQVIRPQQGWMVSQQLSVRCGKGGKWCPDGRNGSPWVRLGWKLGGTCLGGSYPNLIFVCAEPFLGFRKGRKTMIFGGFLSNSSKKWPKNADFACKYTWEFPGSFLGPLFAQESEFCITIGRNLRKSGFFFKIHDFGGLFDLKSQIITRNGSPNSISFARHEKPTLPSSFGQLVQRLWQFRHYPTQ